VFAARAGASSFLLNCESSASTEFNERLQLEREPQWLDLVLGNVVKRALKGSSELARIDGSHVPSHVFDVLLVRCWTRSRFHASWLPSVEPRNLQQRRPCAVPEEALAIVAREDVTHCSRGYWRARRCSGHSLMSPPL